MAVDSELDRLIYQAIRNKRLLRLDYKAKSELSNRMITEFRRGLSDCSAGRLEGKAVRPFPDGVCSTLRTFRIAKCSIGTLPETERLQAAIIGGTKFSFGWNRRRSTASELVGCEVGIWNREGHEFHSCRLGAL